MSSKNNRRRTQKRTPKKRILQKKYEKVLVFPRKVWGMIKPVLEKIICEVVYRILRDFFDLM